MRRGRELLSALAVTGLLGAAVGFSGPEAGTRGTDGPVVKGRWQVQASDARIIGGYGDNFAYDGQDVRAIDGRARVELNTDEGTGRIEVTLRTTEESGPIRFADGRSFSGEIRIIQSLNTSRMEMARIAEEVWLHGDTGNEAPVMPRIFNYFATWGPARILVNGEEVIPMIGSHTMFSEQARNDAGKIVSDQGRVYSPRLDDKTGFTNPDETEFHLVAHTTEPDQANFPPHSGWIHLHFADVEVIQKPDDVEIPYTTESMD